MKDENSDLKGIFLSFFRTCINLDLILNKKLFNSNYRLFLT